MASIFVCLFLRSLKHGRWLSLQDIKNPNDTKFMMLNKWNNKFMWNILKEAYGHGLLHLIIRISGTLQGNEYSDSPLLRRNTRALGESPHARRVTHEARRIILGILRGGARALVWISNPWFRELRRKPCCCRYFAIVFALFFAGAPNENIVQNHWNIALLNVF